MEVSTLNINFVESNYRWSEIQRERQPSLHNSGNTFVVNSVLDAHQYLVVSTMQ